MITSVGLFLVEVNQIIRILKNSKLKKKLMFEYKCMHLFYLYGIRRSLIVIGFITEVKQRRARFIHWMGDRLVTARCCIHSWGSENHVNQMARLTDLELDVKEPQWT